MCIVPARVCVLGVFHATVSCHVSLTAAVDVIKGWVGCVTEEALALFASTVNVL